MSRPVAVLLSLGYLGLAAGYAYQGQWLPAVLLVAAGGWSVWYFSRRRPVRKAGPVVLTGDLSIRATQLVDIGREAEAVRLVRRETGAGLVAATRAVRGLRTTPISDDPTDDQDDVRPS